MAWFMFRQGLIALMLMVGTIVGMDRAAQAQIDVESRAGVLQTGGGTE